MTTRIRIGNLYKPSLGPSLLGGHSQNIHSGQMKSSFTNLDVSESKGEFPFSATFWWPRWCEVAIECDQKKHQKKRHLKPTSKNPHTKHLSKCGRIKPQVRISLFHPRWLFVGFLNLQPHHVRSCGI